MNDDRFFHRFVRSTQLLFKPFGLLLFLKHVFCAVTKPNCVQNRCCEPKEVNSVEEEYLLQNSNSLSLLKILVLTLQVCDAFPCTDCAYTI